MKASDLEVGRAYVVRIPVEWYPNMDAYNAGMLDGARHALKVQVATTCVVKSTGLRKGCAIVYDSTKLREEIYSQLHRTYGNERDYEIGIFILPSSDEREPSWTKARAEWFVAEVPRIDE